MLLVLSHANPVPDLEHRGAIMSLEQYSYFAEVIASIAVVASLIFVALEVRKNTRESEITHWGSVVDRFNAVYRQTENIQLANLVAKGRESYDGLVDERDAYVALFRKHMRYHLGFKGSKEWYDEFERVRGFPPKLAKAIREAID